MLDVMAVLYTILLTAHVDYVITNGVPNITPPLSSAQHAFDKGWLLDHASRLSFYVQLYHIPIAFYSVIL